MHEVATQKLTLDQSRLLLLRPRHLPPPRRFLARQIRHERQPLPDILALDGVPPDLGPSDARRRVLFAAFADLEAQVRDVERARGAVRVLGRVEGRFGLLAGVLVRRTLLGLSRTRAGDTFRQ